MTGLVAVLILLVALVSGQFSTEEDGLQYCRFEVDDYNITLMICENMVSEKDLDDDILSSVDSTATKLVITNSHFRFFMHDTFIGTEFQDITIVNCTIQSLSDTDIAFEGLEDNLVSLSVVNTIPVIQWDLYHLRHLRSLSVINIAKSDLIALTEDMKTIPSHVRVIDFHDDGISWIHSDVFSHLHGLETLLLMKNEIRTLERTMLPNPANDLAVLHLSENQISTLPTDFFSGMPKLISVDLSFNLFHVIEERPFAEIITRIDFFLFHGNPVRCDCRIRWLALIKHNPSTYISAECSAPSYLQGKSVTEIKAKDLWC